MTTGNHIELGVSVPAPLGSLICQLVDKQDDEAFWKVFEAACRSVVSGEMQALANLAYRLATDDEQETLR